MDNSGHGSFLCPLKTVTVDDFSFHWSPHRRSLDQRIPESSSSSVMVESVKGSLSQGFWAWGPMSFSSIFCGQDSFLSSESVNSQHTSSIRKGTERNEGEKCIAPGQTTQSRWSMEQRSAMLCSYRNAHILFRQSWWTAYHFPQELKERKLVQIATGSLHYSKKKIFFKSTHSKWSLIMLLCLWEDVHVLVHARSVIQRFSHVHLVWAQIPVLWNSDRSKPHWNLCRNQHLRWKLKWWQMSECLPEQIRLRHSAHVWCHFSKRLLWHLLGMTSFSLLWAERMKYQEKELNIWDWGLGDI